MFSEGGKISHKRWISVTVAGILGWVIIYASLKAMNASERQAIITATMLFVLAMSGVATIPQIFALVRGGNLPPENVAGLNVIIVTVDALPVTGSDGVWYFFNSNYYYWNGTSFINSGGDRPNKPPVNP